jgi:hypothetical protein
MEPLCWRRERRAADVNPLLVYYLADRPPGTRFTMYNPGVTYRPDVQTTIVAQLEASQVRVVVLDDGRASACEPQNASCDEGSTILDKDIARAY